MDELMRQLDICSYLAQRRAATPREVSEHLQRMGYGASIPTVKRDIADLRHLGVDISADRILGYRLLNWAEVSDRVRLWRDLERRRTELHEQGLA